MTAQHITPAPIVATASGHAPPTGTARAASWALALSLLALLGAVGAMAYVGVTVMPMEAAWGYYLTDTPAAYQWSVLVAFASLLVWSVAGIAALVLGVIGLVGRRGTGRAGWALGLATLAPVLALLALLGSMGVGAALM